MTPPLTIYWFTTSDINMVTSTAGFRAWLKGNTEMKLSPDASVTRILHEGINNFEALLDFDKKSIQALPTICKENIAAIAQDEANGIAAEAPVNGANISSISIRRLITAVRAAKYYTSIGRIVTVEKMYYTNILSNFTLEWDDYE